MRYSLLILFILASLNVNFAQEAEKQDAKAPIDKSVLVDTNGKATLGKVDKKKKEKEVELTEEERTQQLFAAVKAGDTEAAKPMLSAMTYYKHNEEGQTVLTQAIIDNNKDMVKLLVEDAVINLKNKDGETPLTLAIKKGSPEIINLVAVRAKTSLKNDLGESPLFLAIELQDDLKLLKKLISKGADVNRLSNGETPLALAAQMDKLKVVALLVKNGADVSKPNDNGDTPLYIAVAKGNDVIAGILAYKSEDKVKDVNWQTSIGEPLLNISVNQGDKQIVEALIEHGANVNAMDYMDNTPLHLAAQKGYTDVVELLLLNGADLNQRNIIGSTPIMLAAKNGHTELANMLATNGANPEIRNFAGHSASRYANFESIMVKKHLDEAELLENEYQVKGNLAKDEVSPLQKDDK